MHLFATTSAEQVMEFGKAAAVTESNKPVEAPVEKQRASRPRKTKGVAEPGK